MSENAYSRIAVLRALKLGDLLCAVPALRAMRRAWPFASITLIGLPWAAALARRFSHLVDNFIEFPGYPGLPERSFEAGSLPPFLQQVQQQEFSLAVQMHGSGSIVNEVIHLFGADMTAGFYEPGGWRPEGAWIPYPADEHEIFRHLRLAGAIGAPAHGSYLEFPLFREDMLELRQFLARHDLRPWHYVCVHPGCLSAAKWPVSSFAETGDALTAKGWDVVLTGTEEERSLCEEIAATMKSAAINAAGRTDLGGLAALIGQSRMLLCHDTGVSHIAAARRTPSVVIYQGSNGGGWPPLNGELHRFLTGRVTVEFVLREIENLDNAVYSRREGGRIGRLADEQHLFCVNEEGQ